MSDFNDKIKVHTAPGSGTQYVHTIDLLYTQEEKNALYEEAMKQAEKEMSEERKTIILKSLKDRLRERSAAFWGLSQYCQLIPLPFSESNLHDWAIFLDSCLREIERLEGISAKYPLAPVSSTLDRLLDHLFLFDEGQRKAETTLGEIEHKGEKVRVKIKVERGK